MKGKQTHALIKCVEFLSKCKERSDTVELNCPFHAVMGWKAADIFHNSECKGI